MKKWMLTFFLITGNLLLLQAGDGEYAVSKIAPLLLKNANAVLRLEEVKFEVSSRSKAVFKNHYVITILNENGDYWAECYEYYDKFRKIESVEGVLYDASGKPMKKMKLKDMEDLSAISAGSLMEDDRIKKHNFFYRVYPYTIEYTIEINYNSTFHFPFWMPASRGNISVESSTMSMICRDGYQFRYKAFNYPGEPIVTNGKDSKTTTWTINNLPAIVKEPFAPMWHELTTLVIFGPTDFQMDDYKGNMQTWQDFGKFQYALLQGRDQLPENVKQKVQKLIGNITDNRQKIEVLYKYLQENTRYISIQLGIGGWQPFKAEFVAAKAYGDCKALTNYMSSLLKEAGIRSFYSLIRAGENAGYITHDFPSSQFNHVILCAVPEPNDTMWLECTSQTLPCGYLSDFTADRFALLVDEKGGELVRTPRYGVNDNVAKRNLNAILNELATLNIHSFTSYSGTMQDDIHGIINHLSKDKVKEHLQEDLDFATYEINRFDYKELKTKTPVIEELLEIEAINYATISGRRLFILPNVMTRSHRKLSMDAERKFPLVLQEEFTEVDTITIQLPSGYTTELLPKDVNLVTRFGKYSITVKLEGGKLVCHRFRQQYKGRFEANFYNELVSFYEIIFKGDRNRVVLVKSESATRSF